MALSAARSAEVFEVAAGHVGPERVPGLVVLIAQGDEVHLSA
jgi:hypothetical protein